MILLGLAGKARSGKSTIAKFLEENYYFTRIALADPLKLLIYKVFGFVHSKDLDRILKLTQEYKIIPNKHIPDNVVIELMKEMQLILEYNLPLLDNHKIAQLFTLEKSIWKILKSKDLSKDEKARMLYQLVGTDLFRTLAPNIWVELLERRIENLKTKKISRIVIDDVRFENEVNKIRELGGKVGLIIRKGINTDNPTYQHVSEKALPEDLDFYDFLIENSGTLEELYSTANKILSLFQ